MQPAARSDFDVVSIAMNPNSRPGQQRRPNANDIVPTLQVAAISSQPPVEQRVDEREVEEFYH